ncbi:acyl-CoA thioesterase [Ferrovibrio sp.]|uniref:acyl-CoA thioesterase n=1 Tax=Ferrovibrio sp. TaxID=1917215 RepID=UPI003D0A21A9
MQQNEAIAGEALISVHPLDVQWGDCDPADIVFYPNYFAWFDAGTWRLLAEAGYTLQELRRIGSIGFPIVSVEAKFHGPAAVQDSIAVHSRILEWGRSSFQVGHRIQRQDGTLLVEGREKRVLAQPDPAQPGKLKGLPIPADMIRRLGCAG